MLIFPETLCQTLRLNIDGVLELYQFLPISTEKSLFSETQGLTFMLFIGWVIHPDWYQNKENEQGPDDLNEQLDLWHRGEETPIYTTFLTHKCIKCTRISALKSILSYLLQCFECYTFSSNVLLIKSGPIASPCEFWVKHFGEGLVTEWDGSAGFKWLQAFPSAPSHRLCSSADPVSAWNSRTDVHCGGLRIKPLS